MPDFLLWWLFSSHCNAVTLGCAHRGSYTPISPALGHSYPKPISRELQTCRHCTVPAGTAGHGQQVPPIFGSTGFPKQRQPAQHGVRCSTSASDPHISLDLSPGSLSALFSAFPYSSCLTPFAACTFCVPDLVPHLTHSKSF